MIKQFKDYNETQSYNDFETLPRGGYVLKILGVEACQNTRGAYLKIGCDIAEGEYAGFFAANYKAQQSEDKKWRCNYLLSIPNDDGSEQDGWTKRKFKTFTEALEDSNEGYHFDWDETKFKGKLIGGLFNEREFETNHGAVGRATNLAKITTVQNIHDGKFKIPDDKLLSGVRPMSSGNDGFMNIPDGIDEELPF